MKKPKSFTKTQVNKIVDENNFAWNLKNTNIMWLILYMLFVFSDAYGQCKYKFYLLYTRNLLNKLNISTRLDIFIPGSYFVTSEIILLFCISVSPFLTSFIWGSSFASFVKMLNAFTKFRSKLALKSNWYFKLENHVIKYFKTISGFFYKFEMCVRYKGNKYVENCNWTIKNKKKNFIAQFLHFS